MRPTRRSLIGAFGASIIPGAALAQSRSKEEAFDAQLRAALSDDEALQLVRSDREGKSLLYATRAVAPRLTPSSRSISKRAAELILGFEVTDRKRYEERYFKPLWPAGKSGVTLGIGYDLGYVTKAWFREDWSGILSAGEIEALEACCGITGSQSAALATKVDHIIVPWDKAYRQFTTTSLPRYTAQTLSALPNSRHLSDHSLGALVSLSYNRGPSYSKGGERYSEMRAIRLAIWSGEVARIPNEMRKMKRLWMGVPKMAGLIERRELEAQLFEVGLPSAA